MKKLLFAAALLCAPLTMTACATTGTAPATAHMTVGKTISGAASTLKFAEDGAYAAVQSGSLKGPDAARVSADIKLAHQVLISAKAAYDANPSADISAQLAQAAALAAEVLTIVSAHK